MPFKFDDKGNIVTIGEGTAKQPVFIHPNGSEAPFDGDATIGAISRLNGEAKNHREAKEAAEAKLLTFAGIEDGPAALAALETVKNIKAGDLTTAAKVQEIKDAAAKSATEAVATATRAAEEKQRTLTEQNAALTRDLNNHVIGSSFAASKFIAEKLIIPADIAQKVFGDRFKVENGKLVPMGADGNPIFSATDHGNHAGFEEALSVMVSQYANKDSILKGTGAQGSGAQGGGGGGNGKKTATRQQFDGMGQSERMEFSKAGGTVSD